MALDNLFRNLRRRLQLVRNNLGDIWLLKIFEQEFGFSDLLSNYSRTYAWMANQLGHLTLGLGFALILHWVATSVAVVGTLPTAFIVAVPLVTMSAVLLLSVYRLGRHTILVVPVCLALMIIVALQGLPDKMHVACPLGCLLTVFLDWSLDALAVLMALAGVVTIFIGIGVALHNTREDTPALRNLASALTGCEARAARQDDAATGCGAPERCCNALLADQTQIYRRRDSWIPTILSTLALILFLGWSASTAYANDMHRHLGVIVAMGMAGSAILFLCADGRLAALGTMAVISATLLGLWRDPGFLSEEAQEFAKQHVWWLMVIIPTITALTYWRSIRHNPAPKVLVCIALVAAGLLCMLLIFAQSQETLLGVAFAVAAVAISCAKEFGSDLPRVRTDIRKAREARCKNGVAQLGDGQKLSALELGYVDNGIQDTRTDAAFYIAGAYIAAGLPVDPILVGSHTLTPVPNLWASAPELVGLLIFILCFLAFGRNWALRQDAIDKTGTFRANSMALFWGTLTQDGTQICQGCVALFARGNKGTCNCCGKQVDAGPFAGIRHLIVLGAANSGKSSLGAALATEAALSEISNRLDIRPEDQRRKARLIKMSTLRWTHDCARARAEILYNPTRNFYSVFDEEKREIADLIAPAISSKVLLPSAEFVVLDDCHGTPEDLQVVCNRLALTGESEQSTVWLVSTGTPAVCDVPTGRNEKEAPDTKCGSSSPNGDADPDKDFAQTIERALNSKDPDASGKILILNLHSNRRQCLTCPIASSADMTGRPAV